MDPNWKSSAVSPADAVALVKSGAKVFVQGAAATPTPLLDALCDKPGIEGIRLYHMHTEGPARWVEPAQAGRIRSISLFTGPSCRKPVEEGRADFIPVFLSDIPDLFRTKVIALDAVFIQVSPPDRHGDCTLGTSVDSTRAAVDAAPIIIAEINERMPRTHGNTVVPFRRINAFIHTDRPLYAHEPATESEVDAHIGNLIADLVEDGSTLQLGIGGIPDAVLRRLGNKNDLGIHTEMFSDGVVDLAEKGVITNRLKKVHPGRLVTSFVNGSQRLYDFVNDNALVEFHGCDRTNDISLIRKNDKVVAINSAIEVDITGQVCADSIGHRIFSGIGGQMDFMHAAAYSAGGKPIIALPSTAAGGKVSRIVCELKAGAGVVTTRGHVHWIVTEFGAVNLHGLSLRERAEALLSIAHPDFRGDLKRDVLGLRHFSLPPSAPKLG
jgi:acyl-CoA hydrolase